MINWAEMAQGAECVGISFSAVLKNIFNAKECFKNVIVSTTLQVVASERCFNKTPFMHRLLVVLASQLSDFQGDKKF